MRLDVDELLEALEDPVVKIGGTDYTVQYPSFRKRLAIQKMWDSVDWSQDEGQEEMVGFLAESVGLEPEVLLDLPEKVLGQVMGFLLLMVKGIEDPTLLLTE
tara:strand:+ start:82 stop:387 length:306 start_codon:yes stop_codon:yes gene_type:complete